MLGDGLVALLGPTAVFAVVWTLVEVALRLLVPGYRGVLEVALVVFVPLWFLAAYLWVVLLVPLTARAHRRGGVLVVVASAPPRRWPTSAGSPTGWRRSAT